MNTKNEKGLYEVWTVHRGSGRPDRYLASFADYLEALDYACKYDDQHPADETKIGQTWTDSEGFLQFNFSE